MTNESSLHVYSIQMIPIQFKPIPLLILPLFHIHYSISKFETSAILDTLFFSLYLMNKRSNLAAGNNALTTIPATAE